MLTKRGNQKYYAVKVGRIPGIYLTWSDCEKQVKSYGGAKYKSFSSKSEAEDFLRDDTILNNKMTIDNSARDKINTSKQIINDKSSIEYILIYTDGSHFKHTNNYLGY